MNNVNNVRKKLAFRKGFTLVELVVVIAVLAILAGVGTAAYSGYIKKAQEAGDIQQLDVIRTAAASAAAARQETLTEITVSVNDGKANEIQVNGTSGFKVTTASGVIDGPLPTNNGDDPDLWTFLSGNTFVFKSEKYKSDGAHWKSKGTDATESKAEEKADTWYPGKN